MWMERGNSRDLMEDELVGNEEMRRLGQRMEEQRVIWERNRKE